MYCFIALWTMRYSLFCCVTRRRLVDCVWNVMAQAQKPNFVFRRNGRVHLNRWGRQYSRLLAAEVCASAVVMLDTPCSKVVWSLLATHCIRQFPLHYPSRASPCAIIFQLESTYLWPFRGNLSVPSSRVNQAVPWGWNRLSEDSYGSHLMLRMRVFRGVTASFGECYPTFRSIACCGFVVKVRLKAQTSYWKVGSQSPNKHVTSHRTRVPVYRRLRNTPPLNRNSVQTSCVKKFEVCSYTTYFSQFRVSHCRF